MCIGIKTIKFPSNDNDTTRTKVGLHSIAGFPNVLGATHIQIAAPNADEHLYVCRKGYHSINVQAFVIADMKEVFNGVDFIKVKVS